MIYIIRSCTQAIHIHVVHEKIANKFSYDGGSKEKANYDRRLLWYKESTNEAPNKKGKSGATFMTITNGAAIKTETKAVAKEANTDKYPANSNAKDVYSKNLSSNLRTLLSLELETIDDSWFPHLMDEFKKPYFVKLKQFVTKEQADHTVFPPAKDIYSWTRLTPFNKVKVVIIGQDPYHNFNQAHGLAFSVKPLHQHHRH